VPHTTWSPWLLTTFALALGIGCAGNPLFVEPPTADHIRGSVFHDRNGNGERDRFDSGLAGVAVSNGRDVVRSDSAGRYSLPAGEEFSIFVVKPPGFTSPIDPNGLRRFHYSHKPQGSPPSHYPGIAASGPRPDQVDFPLTRIDESDAFDVVLFGDTQPYSISEVDALSHDIVEEVIGVDAAFGVTLGDVVGDDLELFGPVNRAIGLIGIPWVSVPGNHDMNFDAANDAHADESFERVYGPGTHAFEVGRAHFIVLDDVIYGGLTDPATTTQNYIGGLTDDQIAFVENYLAEVPSDHLVVVLTHIPFVGPSERLAVKQRDRERLFAALASHPINFSIASHMHMQRNDFLGPEAGWRGENPHHQLIQGTTSGSWWLGTPDEVGLPHAMMRDGTPNGYSILSIDGNRYAVRYKVARRPADYQMNIFAPDVVVAADASETEVVVNVFAGSERSLVEMRLGPNGEWHRMARVERPDPYFVELKRRERLAGDPPKRPLPPADPSPHLWVATLPADPAAGTALLEVRETDMYGAVHYGRRILRIE
jgi:hypothetical protein